LKEEVKNRRGRGLPSVTEDEHHPIDVGKEGRWFRRAYQSYFKPFNPDANRVFSRYVQHKIFASPLPLAYNLTSGLHVVITQFVLARWLAAILAAGRDSAVDGEIAVEAVHLTDRFFSHHPAVLGFLLEKPPSEEITQEFAAAILKL